MRKMSINEPEGVFIFWRNGLPEIRAAREGFALPAVHESSRPLRTSVRSGEKGVRRCESACLYDVGEYGILKDAERVSNWVASESGVSL